MKQEDKDLLLKDLCARLPYGTKLDTLEGPQELNTKWLAINMCNIASPYLPYLYPLSSMNERQKNTAPFESSLLNAFINGYVSLFEDEELTIDDLNRLYDWLYKNHFDINGLIPKGLAIDATRLNIY